jgi:AraC-like DNA-binding protein
VPPAAQPRVVPKGTLYLWPDGILFLGTDMFNEPHRHFTASVLLSIDGTFEVRTGGTHPESYQGLLVAPNTEQSMDARGARVLILQVDPETDHFLRIADRFERHGAVSRIPDELVERLRGVAAARVDQDSFSPAELWQSIIDTLSIPGGQTRQIDRRVREILRIMKLDIHASLPAAELASRVGLSEGRLIHLFTDEMGLPMRRYALWLRLREAFLTLAEGASLTEASHRAGFSDSAHMSRTFRGMFGIPPSFFQEGRGQVRTEFVLRADPDASAHPGDAERWNRIVATRSE